MEMIVWVCDKEGIVASKNVSQLLFGLLVGGAGVVAMLLFLFLPETN